MVRHIVLWRLKSPRETNFVPIRAALEAQLGRIPGLLKLEVGRSFNSGKRGADFALVVAEHWIADYEL